MATDYPIALIEMQEFIAEQLKVRLDGKLAADEFEDVSKLVVESFRENHGGEPFYMPKAASWECKKIHDAIWSEFTGANHHDLCREFGRSLSQIYRIIARYRRKNKSQLDWCAEK